MPCRHTVHIDTRMYHHFCELQKVDECDLNTVLTDACTWYVSTLDAQVPLPSIPDYWSEHSPLPWISHISFTWSNRNTPFPWYVVRLKKLAKEYGQTVEKVALHALKLYFAYREIEPEVVDREMRPEVEEETQEQEPRSELAAILARYGSPWPNRFEHIPAGGEEDRSQESFYRVAIPLAESLGWPVLMSPDDIPDEWKE